MLFQRPAKSMVRTNFARFMNGRNQYSCHHRKPFSIAGEYLQDVKELCAVQAFLKVHLDEQNVYCLLKLTVHTVTLCSQDLLYLR